MHGVLLLIFGTYMVQSFIFLIVITFVFDCFLFCSINSLAKAYSTSFCSPFIWDCLTEFYSTYDDTLLRWNGAELLTRVGKSFLNKKSPFNKKMELKLQPSSAFFPISRDNITRYVSQYTIWYIT